LNVPTKPPPPPRRDPSSRHLPESVLHRYMYLTTQRKGLPRTSLIQVPRGHRGNPRVARILESAGGRLPAPVENKKQSQPRNRLTPCPPRVTYDETGRDAWSGRKALDSQSASNPLDSVASHRSSRCTLSGDSWRNLRSCWRR